MNVQVKPVTTETERLQAFAIRRAVFVLEQRVPEEIEMDEHDADAHHILAFADERPVGTARWRETSQGIKLERFAVLKPFRGQGVGKRLVEYLLHQLPSDQTIYLNAQEPVITFYEQFGFQCRGPRFFEAGIPHRKMVLNRPAEYGAGDRPS
jgi:predicted GNAT family N-acyltransferase